MTPEALHLWQTMRGPESHWRQSARAVMIRVVREQRDLGRLDDDAALLAAVDAAYPFGERKYLPYKMWLLERKMFRDACSVPAATASADEAAVCMVARDMLADERPRPVAEVKALLDEQAPNRLGRRCPACGARVGQECRDPSILTAGHPPTPGAAGYVMSIWLDGIPSMPVPHEARLTGHLDAGPLFAGPR